MPKNSIATILFVLFASVTSFATPQIPDILLFEGKEYPIRDEILEDYFKKFPERNPKPKDDWCSALWRGYQATFAVSDRRIYLKDVEINVCGGAPTSEFKKVVPDGERLFVDWFSSLVDSGYGENLANPYSLESLDAFEKYSVLEIEKGNVREVRHFDNKGYRTFKKKQFQAFKETKIYELTVKKMLSDNPRINKKDADASIEFWVLSYTKTFLTK